MKKLSILLSYILLSASVFAQRVSGNLTFQTNSAFSSTTFFSPDFLPSVTPQEMDMKTYTADSAASALVLNEYGKAFFISNTPNPPIQFEYHVKIKIFNEDGLKYGSVEIPLYTKDRGTYERIREISGTTFYKEASGITKSVKLNPDMIKTVKLDDHRSVVRFTMPNVAPGAIVEYRYVLEKPFVSNFVTWKFQWDIPKLKSYYNVTIPQLFGYEVELKGPLKLKTNLTQTDKKCYSFNNSYADCLNAVYGMENIPAAVNTGNFSSPRDYKTAVYFQLTDMVAISNFNDRNYGVPVNMGRNWEEFGNYLKIKEDFGDIIKKKFPLKGEFEKITAGRTTQLEKAQAIYNYIRQTVEWNGYDGIFSEDGVKKTMENRKGTSGDINLALISALKAAGIQADPVLISTVDNGRINKELPSFNDLNYVLAKVTIDGKIYLADATDRNISFGQLTPRSMTKEGRVISFGGTDEWIDFDINNNNSK